MEKNKKNATTKRSNTNSLVQMLQQKGKRKKKS